MPVTYLYIYYIYDIYTYIYIYIYIYIIYAIPWLGLNMSCFVSHEATSIANIGRS